MSTPVDNNNKDSEWVDLPYLVMEEMMDGYSGSLRKEALRGPFHSSRVHSIVRVHVLQFCEYGCYIGRNFGKNPHYMVAAKDYKKIVEGICKHHGIPIKVYHYGQTVTATDAIVCWNFGGDNPNPRVVDNDVYSALQALEMDLVYEEMEETFSGKYGKTEEGPCLDVTRGAEQVHFGYSSNYNLGRLPASEGGFVAPKLLGGGVSDVWKD